MNSPSPATTGTDRTSPLNKYAGSCLTLSGICAQSQRGPLICHERRGFPPAVIMALSIGFDVPRKTVLQNEYTPLAPFVQMRQIQNLTFSLVTLWKFQK